MLQKGYSTFTHVFPRSVTLSRFALLVRAEMSVLCHPSRGLAMGLSQRPSLALVPRPRTFQDARSRDVLSVSGAASTMLWGRVPGLLW